MNRHVLLVCFLILFISKTSAQIFIDPSDAGKNIGKIATFTGYVLNVGHKPRSKIISFGLSDDDYKSPQSLIIIIHLKHFDKSYYNSINSLTGKEINLTGKIQLFNSFPVINHYGRNLDINEIIILPGY